VIQVLICEDDGTTRLLLKHLLTRTTPCEVTEVRNGQEALAILGERPFDLLVLDLQMPVMSGPETLRRIRETPTLQDLQVVVLSAENDEAQVREVIELGVVDFLLKPVGREGAQQRLIRAIERLRRRPRTHVPDGVEEGAAAGRAAD
jgi:CheY-like chemotaxis protein